MPSGKVDTTNEQIGQDQTKHISGSGEAAVTYDSGIESVPGPGFESLAEYEKFMNQPIKLMVYPPMNDGDEPIVQVAVNNVNQFVIRGREQTIKRKYVEVLARAKKVNISAHGYKDRDGEAKNVVNVNSSLEYPFQVLEDRDPRGPAWLRKILAEE